MSLPASISYQTLAFTSAADDVTLVARLAAVTGMAPQPDDLGNPQAVYRLDVSAGTPESYVLTFPAAVSVTDVQNVIAACPTAADLATAAAAVATATAWVELRVIRDRWLAQTDYIEAFLNSPTVFSHLPSAIQTDVKNNSAAWVTWRQALRDLPSVQGLDPVAAVTSMPHASNQSPWPASWPKPPATPVIHLT